MSPAPFPRPTVPLVSSWGAPSSSWAKGISAMAPESEAWRRAGVKQFTLPLHFAPPKLGRVNITILIDAIVRQTTVLVAQLATSAGARASLSETANQVFLDLARELKEQGLGNKLIADMFGLSLRTYHNKMRRLSESHTERGESLWDAVLRYVQERKVASRGDVLMRFCRDDERTVRSVLSDLVATGMLFAKGSGDRIVYRAATPAEYDTGTHDEAQGLAHLVWITIARHSPIERGRLTELLRIEASELDVALAPLLADGRVEAAGTPPVITYSSEACVIPLGASVGWEASVFDHYQAMVIAICNKLRQGATSARQGECTGGSTFGFDIWQGHPLRDEVLGFLQETRDRATALRARVDAMNDSATIPEEGRQRVITYFGQTVIAADDSAEMERQ